MVFTEKLFILATSTCLVKYSHRTELAMFMSLLGEGFAKHQPNEGFNMMDSSYSPVFCDVSEERLSEILVGIYGMGFGLTLHGWLELLFGDQFSK